MKRFLALAACLAAFRALAQPEAIVLVAKPGLDDPNFSGAVVLVTHTSDGETLGVVLNRPTDVQLADVAPDFAGAARFPEPLYAGGPVMRALIVALYRANAPPAAAAFRVLDDAYLTMHPDNLHALLEHPPSRLRLFAGFCGWAPGQLEAEIARDSWYVLPATEELVFRHDTSGMWQELVDRARSRRTATFLAGRAIYSKS